MDSLSVDLIKLCANVLEIFGVFMMANAHLKIHGWLPKFRMLIGSMFGTKFSRKSVKASEYMPETRYTTLRGLAFIGVGFLANTGVFLYEMAMKSY